MRNKEFEIGSVLVTVFFLSMLFVSAASAEKIPLNDLKLKQYDLDVTITGIKDSGTYWYNLNGDSTASASEDIDYIQASGTLMGPQFTANYGPESRYNDDAVVASGTLTDYFFWHTTYYNQGHGMYRINGVNYYLDSTATITP
ncbi:hypothetical protein V7O62_01620 [Methanolobus sp. ZRKC2]|uniref:hypothetical protein n=1 Tax=Methanolobus sp. ZRKC2 TaxID=3125783 RepID=UPI0032539E01